MKLFFRFLKWLLGAAIFFLLFILALNNRAPVNVQLLAGYRLELPLVVLVLLTFAIGLVAGGVAVLLSQVRSANEPATSTNAAPNNPTSSTQDGI